MGTSPQGMARLDRAWGRLRRNSQDRVLPDLPALIDPRCGAQMVLRTARKGKNQGNAVLGTCPTPSPSAGGSGHSQEPAHKLDNLQASHTCCNDGIENLGIGPHRRSAKPRWRITLAEVPPTDSGAGTNDAAFGTSSLVRQSAPSRPYDKVRRSMLEAEEPDASRSLEPGASQEAAALRSTKGDGVAQVSERRRPQDERPGLQADRPSVVARCRNAGTLPDLSS